MIIRLLASLVVCTLTASSLAATAQASCDPTYDKILSFYEERNSKKLIKWSGAALAVVVVATATSPKTMNADLSKAGNWVVPGLYGGASLLALISGIRAERRVRPMIRDLREGQRLLEEARLAWGTRLDELVNEINTTRGLEYVDTKSLAELLEDADRRKVFCSSHGSTERQVQDEAREALPSFHQIKSGEYYTPYLASGKSQIIEWVKWKLINPAAAEKYGPKLYMSLQKD